MTSPLTKSARCNSNNPITTTTASQIKKTTACHDSRAGCIVGIGSVGSIGRIAGVSNGSAIFVSVSGITAEAGSILSVYKSTRSLFTGAMTGDTFTGVFTNPSALLCGTVAATSTDASSSPTRDPRLNGDDSDVGRISLSRTSIHIQ